MESESHYPSGENKPPRKRRRVLRFVAWGCGTMVVLFVSLIVLGILLLSKVPRSYPAIAQPIAPPDKQRVSGGGLAHFDSPYLGHTGSWDGKGGAIFGRSKIPDLEIERGMGLHWTFMPVYWRAMEPAGPADLSGKPPEAWQALDAFVIEAQRRGLNILMQAPVMGGNATGPPDWAGRRKVGSSAPANMEAAAAFAGKLAARYCPGGTLALQQRWGNSFGVRAWELDNEPESYRTSWKNQAVDYAEFVTRTATAITKIDPQAVIVAPGMAGGPHGIAWLEETLRSNATLNATNQTGFSIGPITDVVSFHCYEGLETAFSGEDRTIERDFLDVRTAFEKWEDQQSSAAYARKQDYWHTEGNFDFFGVLSQERRAAWRFQFFTRAFAAGIRKVCVMDASPAEQVAVRAYIEALPDPFPMLPDTQQMTTLQGRAVGFAHPIGQPNLAGRVWVLWATAGQGDALVELPVLHSNVTRVDIDGRKESLASSEGKIRLTLKGDKKMAPGVLIIDRAESEK